MSKLGILLACKHYPAVSHDVRHIDAQLRHWLRDCGVSFDENQVYPVFEGVLPQHATSCDAWVVSGVPLVMAVEADADCRALNQFLRAAAYFSQPIFAVNHAEHVLHCALAGIDATRPDAPALPRTIRNPFRSFCSRYPLHRFNSETRQIDALERPDEICPRHIFSSWRVAA